MDTIFKNSQNSKTCDLQISASLWSDKFELPDKSYSVSDIQDYFEYIRKSIENRLIILELEYKTVNKIKNKFKFRIKTGYYLELLTPETMKLPRSTKRKILKYETRLETIEVILAHCNIVSNDYQHN